MLAYHSDSTLKDAVLAEMVKHREADKLVQNYGYWQDGKGCAVGCTLESLRLANGARTISHDSHRLYEKYLGVPQALARIEDGIFEGLPKADAQLWPERFLAAIRPGADLSMVVPKFIHWLLTTPDGGVQRRAAQRPNIKPSIDAVGALYQQWVEGTKPSATEWREARQNAYADAADADAAYDAAAAAYAADDAAAAAYAADAADAVDAYDAADAVDARRTERQRQAEKLIELLEAA